MALLKHDIAYACFLAPGAFNLIASVSDAIPLGETAGGGIVVFVLIPLAYASLVTASLGVCFSILYWRDGVLPLLSILTILMVAEQVTAAGSVEFYKATGLAYGILVLVLEASWFFLRRRRFYAT